VGHAGIVADRRPTMSPLDPNAPIYAVTGTFLVDDTLGRQPILSTAMSRRLGTSYTMDNGFGSTGKHGRKLITLIQTTVASQQMRQWA